MKPGKIWANLGVEDLERTTKFYTQLGFTPNGRSAELTSFVVGEDRFIIHFFLKEILQSNINSDIADPRNGSEIVFTISAKSREQVDSWEREVELAGGKIITAAGEFGNEYYGFLFADPDGHKFNVFYMKGL